MTEKKRTTIYLKEENYNSFKSTGLNLSEFCDECIETFLQITDDELSPEIRKLEEQIHKLEYQKYILTSRYSQDYEKQIKLIEVLPELWKDYTNRSGDLFFGIIDISEFDELRNLTGFLKKDLMDIAGFLVHGEDRADYDTLCNDYQYCLKRFNIENDRNIGSDVL